MDGSEVGERRDPHTQRLEDDDTARVVARIQAGDRDAFACIYSRYFERVYTYLRLVLRDAHEAEDAAQQVFVQALRALPRYERRAQPFRGWLFTIARNVAINQMKKSGRLELDDPAQIDRRRERAVDAEPDLNALEWISDSDLLLFVERLPLVQRQVLLLRYMLDLSNAQIAAVLGRPRDEIKVLHYRGIGFLKQRLTAVGRIPRSRGDSDVQRRFRQAGVLRARRFALR